MKRTAAPGPGREAQAWMDEMERLIQLCPNNRILCLQAADLRKALAAGAIEPRLAGLAISVGFWLHSKEAARGMAVTAGAMSGGRTRKKDLRNVELAREFHRRRPLSKLSDTALMKEIGSQPPYNLTRSAAITAISAGISLLKK